MTKTHVDRILASVASPKEAAQSSIAASWKRCFTTYHIDPTTGQQDLEPDSGLLKLMRDKFGRLVSVAEPQLDDLYKVIGHCGCGIFLTDSNGLILSEKTGAADKTAFNEWGLQTGVNWSEEAIGTNGIGTCLAEGRAVTIHRDQHYLPQNTGMSCIDAPIFAPDGELAAALNVSSARADQTEGFNQLISAIVSKVATQIEVNLFRDAHAGHRIMLAASHDDTAMLFAVDRDEIVVGATRAARSRYELERTGELKPRSLRDLTGEHARGLVGAERAAVKRALTRAEGNVSAAARELGIGRATLYRRMKRLEISE